MSDQDRPGGMPDDEVVEEFMKGNLRADQFQDLCDALKLRIRNMADLLERTSNPAERTDLEKRIKQARMQLSVLRQEQAISQFVEDSLRVTLKNDAANPDPEDEENW